MIHDKAANAVGAVFVDEEHKGHCVLIGPRMAVTCAHVLSKGADKPNLRPTLEFYRIEVKTTAKIVGWKAYDTGLSAGTDMALLELETCVPDGSWVQMEPNRPLTDTSVVALEFQTALSDGDLRDARVRYGKGSVISLEGDNFIDPGMSGTGLFYREPGERLLGIVAWRPNTPGQTEAYAIPADEIMKLIEECADTPVTDTLPALFEALTECFLARVGGNLRPLLQDVVEAARCVIEKPAADWTEFDVEDLLNLHFEITEVGEDGIAMPPGLAEVLARLSDLTAQLATDADLCNRSLSVDGATARELEELRGRLQEFRMSTSCPTEAHQPADTLVRVLEMATVSERMRPLQLSRGNANLQRAAGDAYRGLARVLPALLGRRADLLPPGTIFTDSPEPWAPEMVVMPTGRFLMGSPEDEEDGLDDERPQHEVQIDQPFAMARFALTFEEYDLFCEGTGREKPEDEGWGRNRRPVINVDWDDAKAWCDWISEKTGVEWYLPSEAEWEFACRAGTDTPYSFGDVVTSEQANFMAYDQVGTYRRQTVPVDHPEFRPNWFGLWQMHGNVLEWCEDDFVGDYKTPRSQAPLIEDPRGSCRVVRGGSWIDLPGDLRSALRYWYVPDFRSGNFGFRPARTLFTP